MPAYIVVDLTPTDSTKLQQYSVLAADTLIPFGGEFLAKGAVEALHGESRFQVKVIIAFPDRESASGWYNSQAYQEVIDLRNEGMESQFHLVG